MVLPVARTDQLLVRDDPVPDTYSGTLFHFHHHCGFRRFMCISHTVTGRFSTILGEMTDAHKLINPQQSGFKSRVTFG